jgi:hypothetical protein
MMINCSNVSPSKRVETLGLIFVKATRVYRLSGTTIRGKLRFRIVYKVDEKKRRGISLSVWVPTKVRYEIGSLISL